MFDFEDFLLCVECLLLGTEESRELWKTTGAAKSTLRTWRSAFQAGDFQLPCETSASDTDTSGNTSEEKPSYTVEFMDVIFRHYYDPATQKIRPNMQIGVLLSRCRSDTENAGDKLSIYTLSSPLSQKDIAEHYKAIGAELDGYTPEEHLNLARMFANALQSFQRLSVHNPNQVLLFYKEFDSYLNLLLPTPHFHELANDFVSAVLMGVVEPRHNGHQVVTKEDVNAIRTLAMKGGNPKSRTKPTAVKPSSSGTFPTPPKNAAKAKSTTAKVKQKVVLMNRKPKKANVKLLPK